MSKWAIEYMYSYRAGGSSDGYMKGDRVESVNKVTIQEIDDKEVCDKKIKSILEGVCGINQYSNDWVYPIRINKLM